MFIQQNQPKGLLSHKKPPESTKINNKNSPKEGPKLVKKAYTLT